MRKARLIQLTDFLFFCFVLWLDSRYQCFSHSRQEKVVPQSQVRRALAGQAQVVESDGQEEEEDESKGEEADAEDPTGRKRLGRKEGRK